MSQNRAKSYPRRPASGAPDNRLIIGLGLLLGGVAGLLTLVTWMVQQ